MSQNEQPWLLVDPHSGSYNVVYGAGPNRQPGPMMGRPNPHSGSYNMMYGAGPAPNGPGPMMGRPNPHSGSHNMMHGAGPAPNGPGTMMGRPNPDSGSHNMVYRVYRHPGVATTYPSSGVGAHNQPGRMVMMPSSGTVTHSQPAVTQLPITASRNPLGAGLMTQGTAAGNTGAVGRMQQNLEAGGERPETARGHQSVKPTDEQEQQELAAATQKLEQGKKKLAKWKHQQKLEEIRRQQEEIDKQIAGREHEAKEKRVSATVNNGESSGQQQVAAVQGREENEALQRSRAENEALQETLRQVDRKNAAFKERLIQTVRQHITEGKEAEIRKLSDMGEVVERVANITESVEQKKREREEEKDKKRKREKAEKDRKKKETEKKAAAEKRRSSKDKDRKKDEGRSKTERMVKKKDGDSFKIGDKSKGKPSTIAECLRHEGPLCQVPPEYQKIPGDYIFWHFQPGAYPLREGGCRKQEFLGRCNNSHCRFKHYPRPVTASDTERIMTLLTEQGFRLSEKEVQEKRWREEQRRERQSGNRYQGRSSVHNGKGGFQGGKGGFHGGKGRKGFNAARGNRAGFRGRGGYQHPRGYRGRHGNFHRGKGGYRGRGASQLGERGGHAAGRMSQREQASCKKEADKGRDSHNKESKERQENKDNKGAKKRPRSRDSDKGRKGKEADQTDRDKDEPRGERKGHGGRRLRRSRSVEVRSRRRNRSRSRDGRRSRSRSRDRRRSRSRSRDRNGSRSRSRKKGERRGDQDSALDRREETHKRDKKKDKSSEENEEREKVENKKKEKKSDKRCRDNPRDGEGGGPSGDEDEEGGDPSNDPVESPKKKGGGIGRENREKKEEKEEKKKQGDSAKDNEEELPEPDEGEETKKTGREIVDFTENDSENEQAGPKRRKTQGGPEPWWQPDKMSHEELVKLIHRLAGGGENSFVQIAGERESEVIGVLMIRWPNGRQTHATARRWALNTLLDLLNHDYVKRMYDNLKEGKYVLQKYYEGTGKYVVVFLSLKKFTEGRTRAGKEWKERKEYDKMGEFRVTVGKQLAELGQELQQQQIRVVNTMSEDDEEDEERDRLLNLLHETVHERMLEEIRLHTERTGEDNSKPVYNKISWCNKAGYISSLIDNKVTHSLWRLLPLIPWLRDKVALVDEHGKFRVTTEKEEQGTIRHEIRMEPEGLSLRMKTEIPGITNIPWSLGQNNAVFQCLREITSIQPIELHGIATVEDEKAIEVGRYRTQLMLRMALEHKRGKINVPSEGFFDCAGPDYGWERYSASS